MRGIARTVALSAWIVAIPAAASAQSAMLTCNTAYVLGGPWLQPNSVLTARLAPISAEFSF